jgi:hypothetical protein
MEFCALATDFFIINVRLPYAGGPFIIAWGRHQILNLGGGSQIGKAWFDLLHWSDCVSFELDYPCWTRTSGVGGVLSRGRLQHKMWFGYISSSYLEWDYLWMRTPGWEHTPGPTLVESKDTHWVEKDLWHCALTIASTSNIPKFASIRLLHGTVS